MGVRQTISLRGQDPGSSGFACINTLFSWVLEEDVVRPWLSNGRFSNLRIRHATPIGNDRTYAIRVNGETKDITVTVGAGEVEAIDDTHSIQVQDGDLVCLTGGGAPGGGATPIWLTLEFDGDDPNVSAYTTEVDGAMLFPSIRGGIFHEDSTGLGATSLYYDVVSAAGVLERYELDTKNAPGADTLTTQLYVNDVLDGSTVLVATGSERRFVWSGSLRLERGDRVSIEAFATGTPSISGHIGIRFVADNDGESNVCNNLRDLLANGVVGYAAPWKGVSGNWVPDEADVYVLGGTRSFELRGLIVSGFDFFGDPMTFTVSTRVNGASSQIVSIAEGITGESGESKVVNDGDQWAVEFNVISGAFLSGETRSSWTMFALSEPADDGDDDDGDGVPDGFPDDIPPDTSIVNSCECDHGFDNPAFPGGGGGILFPGEQPSSLPGATGPVLPAVDFSGIMLQCTGGGSVIESPDVGDSESYT